MAEYLQSQSRLEGVGGAVYLAELAQSTISAANAEHYSTIVRDKSLLRSLIGAGSEIISNCYDASREVQKLLDESEQAAAGKGRAALGRPPASRFYFRRMSSKGISVSMAPKCTPSTRAVCTTMLVW